MTSLYDPQRRRIGGTPQLNGPSPGFAVPHLTIWPEERLSGTETVVRVSAMIPVAGEGYTAREVSNTIATTGLPWIIAQYRANPEQFLETFFNIELEDVGCSSNQVPATKTRRTPKIAL